MYMQGVKSFLADLLQVACKAKSHRHATPAEAANADEDDAVKVIAHDSYSRDDDSLHGHKRITHMARASEVIFTSAD